MAKVAYVLNYINYNKLNEYFNSIEFKGILQSLLKKKFPDNNMYSIVNCKIHKIFFNPIESHLSIIILSQDRFRGRLNLSDSIQRIAIHYTRKIKNNGIIEDRIWLETLNKNSIFDFSDIQSEILINILTITKFFSLNTIDEIIKEEKKEYEREQMYQSIHNARELNNLSNEDPFGSGGNEPSQIDI